MDAVVSQLQQAASRAMAAGDMNAAQSALLEALTHDGADIGLWLNLAAVRQRLHDVGGAFDALRKALEVDSRSFPALLMRASLLDRLGRKLEAASAYGIALVQAPPDHAMDPLTLKAVLRARSVHAQYVDKLGRFIRERTAAAGSECTPAERRRLEAFIATTLRTRKRYQQEPVEYCYPGLPPIEFYERGEFPWLPEFEGATESVRQELAAILAEDEAGFVPYIQYVSHVPLDQWRELNRSPRWSAYHFYEHGRRVEERCRRAPRTMQALGRLPQPQVELRSPTAMFSVLKPRTRIPPHHGVANFRLVVHLPLVLPPGCGFRVGGEMREWRLGEAWVFDDTIEHEAWNESDQTRVILICDIWSPRLSPEERDAIRSVIAATDAFHGTVPEAGA